MKAHPWLRPLHRRIATAAACGLWVLFELWQDPQGMWFLIALACTGYAVWDFFLSGQYRKSGD